MNQKPMERHCDGGPETAKNSKPVPVSNEC